MSRIDQLKLYTDMLSLMTSRLSLCQFDSTRLEGITPQLKQEFPELPEGMFPEIIPDSDSRFIVRIPELIAGVVSDSNRYDSKDTKEPELAVFCVIDDHYFGFNGKLNDDPDTEKRVREDGVTIVTMKCDWTLFDKVLQERVLDISNASNKPYTGRPHGQVIYNTEQDVFYVTCSKDIAESEKAQELVRKACNLSSSVKFYERAIYNRK